MKNLSVGDLFISKIWGYPSFKIIDLTINSIITVEWDNRTIKSYLGSDFRFYFFNNQWTIITIKQQLIEKQMRDLVE